MREKQIAMIQRHYVGTTGRAWYKCAIGIKVLIFDRSEHIILCHPTRKPSFFFSLLSIQQIGLVWQCTNIKEAPKSMDAARLVHLETSEVSTQNWTYKLLEGSSNLPHIKEWLPNMLLQKFSCMVPYLYINKPFYGQIIAKTCVKKCKSENNSQIFRQFWEHHFESNP